MSSITKKGEIESASRPLMNFGELNDNIIKERIFLFQISWVGFYLYIIYALTHVKKELNKKSLLLKVKHIVKESKRQVFMRYYQMVSIYGLAHLRYKLLKNIIARLHGLIKIKGDIHLWARFIGLIYGSLQCMKYGHHS